MLGIESLENRRLFAVLVPDVTWADDGKLPPAPLGQYDTDTGDSIFAGQSASRLIVHQATSGGDYREFHSTTIRRFHADGTPDVRFRPVYFNLTYTGVDQPPDVATDLDASGGVVVGFSDSYNGRTTNSSIGIVRYSSTGRGDKSFFASLLFRKPRDQRNLVANVRTLKALPDGSVAALIDLDSLTIAKPLTPVRVTVLAKFKADGTLDKRFGKRGLLEVGTNVTDPSSVGALLADARGRLYLKTPKTVVRLGANGGVEQGYGNTKRGTVLLDASGRLLIARPTAYGATVSRYTDAGTLDTTFAGDGTDDVVTAGESGGVTAFFADGDALVLQSHEEIFRISAAGIITATGDTSSLKLIAVGHNGQYLADGDGSPTLLRAATAAALGNSGRLYIRTNDAGDDVYVRAADYTHVQVGVNGTTWQFAKSKVKVIDADLGGGNNAFNSSLDVPTTVVSGAGRDTVTTGSAADDISTGRGSDGIHSGGGGDTVRADAGNDTVDVGTANDVDTDNEVFVTGKTPGRTTVRGHGGGLRVSVESPTSTVDVEFTGRSAFVDATNSTGGSRIILNTTEATGAYGGEGDDSIVTGSGDDTLQGNGGSDTLRAGAGDDQLYGWDGYVIPMPSRNTLDGGTGEDHYWRESSHDTLIDVEIEEDLTPLEPYDGGM